MSTKQNSTKAKASAVTVQAEREWTPEEKEAIQVAHTLTVQARESGRQASILQARAVQAATPFVGKVSDWSTWADYARDLGIDAKAGIARLKNMARALDLGIDPEADPDTWSLLSSLANVGTVSAALKDAKATPAKVRTALRKAKAEKAKPSTRPAGKATATEKDAKAVEMPRNVSGLLDLLETVTARLAASTITPKEYERLAIVVESLGDLKPTATKAQAKRSA